MKIIEYLTRLITMMSQPDCIVVLVVVDIVVVTYHGIFSCGQ